MTSQGSNPHSPTHKANTLPLPVCGVNEGELAEEITNYLWLHSIFMFGQGGGGGVVCFFVVVVVL